MLKETKKFELQADGKLKIDVDTSNELSIPHEKENVRVGNMVQVTHQFIDKDKIIVLQSFIKNQKESAEGQLENLRKEQEKLKDVKDDILPEKTLADVQKYLAQGNKKGKLNDALKQLGSNLNNISRKKQLVKQIEYLDKQVKIVQKDWNDLNAAIGPKNS